MKESCQRWARNTARKLFILHKQAVSNLMYWKVSLTMAGGLDKMVFKVPS